MNSLPTVNLTDYQVQNNVNSEQIATMFAYLFPHLTMPYGDIYNILSDLDNTRVNPQILPRVVRSVNNILTNTGQGQVIVHVIGEKLTLTTKIQEAQIPSRMDIDK